MKPSILSLLLLLPIYAFCQQGMRPGFKIYNVAKHKQVTLEDIIADIATADVLFFGEEHNDSTGHVLEYLLLKQLAAKYPGKVALSMEMFETDVQTVMDEYLLGLIREKNFLTDARVWPNYKDYRPMIEFARAQHIAVIAANAPARYTSMVNRLGLKSLQQLGANGKSYLPPYPIDTATGAYYEKFVNIMGGHAGMAGMQMYQAQNLWDATMGWSIARFCKDHPGYKIIQINGGFHSEEKLGTAVQLKKYAPTLKILNVAAYADDSFENPEWHKFSLFGDYIILTDPKLPRSF